MPPGSRDEAGPVSPEDAVNSSLRCLGCGRHCFSLSSETGTANSPWCVPLPVTHCFVSALGPGAPQTSGGRRLGPGDKRTLSAHARPGLAELSLRAGRSPPVCTASPDGPEHVAAGRKAPPWTTRSPSLALPARGPCEDRLRDTLGANPRLTARVRFRFVPWSALFPQSRILTFLRLPKHQVDFLKVVAIVQPELERVRKC